jgi:peptidoglycan/LPS O-acetylase OafA/YrhL
MWPRVVEVMVGFWLAASPFIFRHPADQKALWTRDLLCAFLVACFALLSFSRRARRAHLGIIPVAGYLVLAAFLSEVDPPPAALQNDLLVGVVLLMLAILPSEASLPPRGWREEEGV